MSEQKIAEGFLPPGSSPSPSATAIFGSFLRLGITAFGGPAMIAHIKEMSVKRNKWLTEETFKDGVVICQSVPGATAMQMAAYVGLRVRGVRGAVASYVGFGLPAFLLMLALAVSLFRFQGVAPGGFPVPGASGDGRRHCGERDVPLRAGHREKTGETWSWPPSLPHCSGSA